MNPNDVVLISSSDEEEDDDVILISSDDEDDCSESDDNESGQQDYDVIELMDSDEDKPVDHVPRGIDNQGGNNSNELSTLEIKSYLRKHGMRLSGTKEECMERIIEHVRLKVEGGESLYPRSSFSINCTGDACKGDVVLFRQNIRKGIKIVGTRSVAGRIVTESYGASCQQHTFTVEVLWSKRYKKLDPLSILLVKGRYLYKYGTYRQPWENEAERLTVLEEKHSRGNAARLKRKLRQTGFGSSNDRGRKCRKLSDKGYCKSKQPTQIDKQTSFKRKGKSHIKESTSASKKKVVPALFQKMISKVSTRPDPNLNPTRQEESSSFPCDTTLVPYGHQNNGQREANRVSNQPPGYHHHNHQQPIPRFKSKYPISSFSVDCTGDACEGDVVLFKQDVYKRKKVPWKQGTIVGRIVKDIYSAPKRRHDFTIEVLWTKGALHLNPFSVVVVKDWNVYRFGTLRQPWENEAERSEVLKEKHRRAEAANKYKRKLWKTDITSSNNAGIKSQKVSREGPSRNIQPAQKDKHKPSRKRAAALVKKSIQAHKSKAVRFEKTELNRSKESTFCPDLNPNLKANPDSNLNANPELNFKLKASSNVNPNSNLNPNPNINSTPTPNLNPKPNSNSNQMQKPKPNPTQKPNPKQPNSNLNPNINSTPTPNLNPKPKPNPNQNLNQNQMQKTKPNPTQKSKPNPTQPNTNLNPNINLTPTPNLNPKPNSNLNLNQMQKPKPNPTQKPKPNTNPNAKQKPMPKQMQEPKLNPTLNPNPYMNSNLNPYPNPNFNIYSDHHRQEASSSFHHDRTLLPNFPPHGFPPNLTLLGLLLNQSAFGPMPHQPPHGFNHNLPPYEFSGFGEQWGPNFYQPPDHYHRSW